MLLFNKMNEIIYDATIEYNQAAATAPIIGPSTGTQL